MDVMGKWGMRSLLLAPLLAATIGVTQGPGGGGPSPTPGIFIQAGNGPMPSYAAGTCNTITANILAYPAPGGGGCSIILARLYLGNDDVGYTMVDEYVWPSGEPLVNAASLAARFDSTHFEPGSELTVRVQYLDNLSRYFYLEKEMLVKNQALIGNHTFSYIPGSQSHDEVESALGTAYDVVTFASGNLTLSNWQAWVPGSNFIWVTTHGTPDIYEMQNGTGVSDGPSGDSHKTWVSWAMVGPTTLPPYNSPGVPPCNFMFVDACDTLQADFSDTLHPQSNLYMGHGAGSALWNQYVAGWTVGLAASLSEDVASILCSFLVSGYTAELALIELIYELDQMGIEDTGGNQVDWTSVGYGGNENARVRGVYTGYSGVETGWYISL